MHLHPDRTLTAHPSVRSRMPGWAFVLFCVMLMAGYVTTSFAWEHNREYMTLLGRMPQGRYWDGDAIGDLLFMSSGGQIECWDFSDAQHPELLGTLAFPERISDLVIVSGHLYVVSRNN